MAKRGLFERYTPQELQDELRSLYDEVSHIAGRLNTMSFDYRDTLDDTLALQPEDIRIEAAKHLGELYGKLSAASSMMQQVSVLVHEVNRVRLVPQGV